MRIAEIYHSVQGEGALTGTPSIFVRTSGCNLRCWFCDTPYTSWQPEGHDLAIEEIVERCRDWTSPHVVLTGGEPMLFAELIPLTQQLAAQGRHITIETAGTLYLPVTCDLMSISPKLSNSAPTAAQDAAWRQRHERSRHAPEVIRRLTSEYDYQLKFVIDTPADIDEVAAYLAEFPRLAPEKILLMPQGTDPQTLAQKTEWLAPRCTEQGYTLCPRRHIEWFGFNRGT